MRTLPTVALAGAGAALLAGAGFAAPPKTATSSATAAKAHVMNVPLPDGSVARVEYVGDVAPKVTVAPRPIAGDFGMWGMPFPSFAGFDRMIEEMNRQTHEMMRRAQEMPHKPAAAAPYIASYGGMPAGETSTTVVSVSNGGATCTRTTQVVSQGAGKPPKVTSNVSGQCSGEDKGADRATHPA